MARQEHDIKNYSIYQKDLAKTLSEVQIDVDWSEQQLLLQDIQFNRRTYIKSIVEFVEFYIWFIKSIYISKAMNINEIEEAYLNSNLTKLNQLNKKGNHKAIIVTDIKCDLIILLTKFEHTFDNHFDLQNSKTNQFLDNLLLLKAIRNRITHPKKHSAFIIKENEKRIALSFYNWFNMKSYLWFENIIENGNFKTN